MQWLIPNSSADSHCFISVRRANRVGSRFIGQAETQLPHRIQGDVLILFTIVSVVHMIALVAFTTGTFKSYWAIPIIGPPMKTWEVSVFNPPQ